MDAGGRTLGVLDMLGGQDDGDGNTTGAWTWYAYGGQRLAKTTPAPDQQPDILTRDLARKANADADDNEAIYQALITYIYAENQANGGLEYPFASVMLKTAPGQYQMIDADVYAQNLATDSTFASLLHQKYTFRSSRDQVSVKRFDSPKVLLLSVEELMGEGKAKSGSNGVPFYYLPAEFDTRLPEVTYYLHDHLGNMRVTYSITCVEGTQVRTLMHAADYYAYGSILRQHIYDRQEKYLTTHHERDLETGLDYRGARYYDADVARFLSLDPLAGGYAGWSPYNYVMGNPISLIDPTGRSVDNYVFNEDGNFVRKEENDQPDKLVIENSKSGERADYDFNDREKDVASLESLMSLYGEDFKDVKMVYGLSKDRIGGIMRESGAEPMSYLGRRWFAATESGSGKMDFSSYHLSTELRIAGEAYRWDGKSILYDNGPSPFFTVQGHHTAYNLMDMGNWLWGNAVNRIGGSSNDARSWSLWNDANDTPADQRAIQTGWFFQEGYQPIGDCPQNR